MPIRRLLVANRGEIARRIFRTCREMGISPVAVYAEPDARAPFVREADEAIALGGTTSAETYLDIEKLIAAARTTGADAIHPGYGFLSENAAFARAVIDAGLAWVGPSPEAIAAMGDKLAAKKLLAGANVPLLPSVEIPEGVPFEAAKLLTGMAFPLLVKAAAGGGGRGMRIVESADALAGAIESARREAEAAFGDGTVFLERDLVGARHIEVQVLGDAHGNLIHGFERECSIQRRHQKIIEEAPSPAVDATLRERMTEAALSAARAIGYTSAGTVELLLAADGHFYFLEMNTRLQVEHPVTEAITGLDLVREQIRVANGEALSVRQEQVVATGHAIEVRLYAEDPGAGFLPSPGTVHFWEPAPSPYLRFDSGVESGSEVSVHFDPMLAKVIAHAQSRGEAAAKLASGLERLRLHGLTTNRDFLVGVLRHPAFVEGDTTTDFIERHAPAPFRQPGPEDLDFALAAALLSSPAGAPSAPWSGMAGAAVDGRFRIRDQEIAARLQRERDGGFVLTWGERRASVRLRDSRDDAFDIEVDGRLRHLRVFSHGDRTWVQDAAGDIELVRLPRFPEAAQSQAAAGYTAPMPGKIVTVAVAPGDSVERGELLVILEAMKMEHRIVAQEAGVIAEVRVQPGQQVDLGHTLIVFQGAAQ